MSDEHGEHGHDKEHGYDKEHGEHNKEWHWGDRDRRSEGRWTIDKHIPLALMLTIALQTGALVWYARGITKDVETHTEQIADLRARAIVAERLQVTTAVTETRMVAVENELRLLRAAIEQIAERKKQP